MSTLYKVTGRLTNGKRFKTIFTSNEAYAMGINLFWGSVWRLNETSHKWQEWKRVR